MTAVQRIREKLTRDFAPTALEVVDESERHAGHLGARPGGETHFRVKITAQAFRGKGRVEAHRMIYAALQHEIAGGVHALAIEAKGS
jgi:BolA protein